MKSQKKVGSTKVNNGLETERIAALEDSLDLQFPLRFELRGRSVGAFVLSRDPELKKLKFVFGFECRGIHSTLKAGQRGVIFDAIESGLKDLPAGETMTVHMGSFSSDTVRQQQLTGMVNMASTDRLKFLLLGEKQRVQELTRQGIRKPKFLRLYVTYTIDPQAEGANDSAERLVSRILNQFHQFTGQLPELQQQRYESLFTRAFTDGFQLWEQLLANKMGLNVRPLLEDELWESVWSRFNESEAPPLPQRVVMSESGLSEDVHSDLHPTSLLVSRESACPYADRAWVKVKNRFVGVLTFVHKPAGWSSKYDQMRYLWDILSRDNVTDTEVFCQLSRANEGLVKTNMQRLTKQSIVSSNLAASKQSVDVVANMKTRRAVAAQEQLYDGSVPLNTAVTILVHRKNPSRLDEACRYIESCVRRPAEVEREREYAWRLWLQTLPIHWDPLLTTPFNRRMIYLSSEAPGFMPLMRPREGDGKGFELLSEEGGVPIHLDLFDRHRNMGIFGTTRSGKSVLVSSILTHALARSIPVVILDFPTDTASTFKDYVNFLGPKTAAYFDIGRETNNLMEPPDLRSMPLKEQQERMREFIQFLETSLMTMVLGNTGSNDILILRRRIRTQINGLLNRFFNDAQITQRYTRAFEAGFGTPEWQDIPTLKDFYTFCRLENLNSYEESDSDPSSEPYKAMSFIRSQLDFWLNSRVGQSISGPSSFRTDVPLMVFALRNLSEDDDAAVLSLSAYAVALRNALKSPRSIFFIDESPILFGFPDIAELVARLCANGAKAGVGVIISAQDPDTIARSGPASKILQNLSTRLVGRLEQIAVASFVKFFGYPEEIIARNATENFFPKAEGLYSQWLLDEGDRFTYCRYYSPLPQLALTANNPNEQAARSEWMAAFENPLEGLAIFTRQYVESIRSGRKAPDGPPPELRARRAAAPSSAPSPSPSLQDGPPVAQSDAKSTAAAVSAPALPDDAPTAPTEPGWGSAIAESVTVPTLPVTALADESPTPAALSSVA